MKLSDNAKVVRAVIGVTSTETRIVCVFESEKEAYGHCDKLNESIKELYQTINKLSEMDSYFSSYVAYIVPEYHVYSTFFEPSE